MSPPNDCRVLELLKAARDVVEAQRKYLADETAYPGYAEDVDKTIERFARVVATFS